MTPDPRNHDLLEQRAFLVQLAGGLLRSVGDPAYDGEDVAQDALRAALEADPPVPNQPGGLRPWLATVARNAKHNQVRSHQRRTWRERRWARRDEAPSPDEVHARLEMGRLLLGCVQELPEKYRSTLFLRFYEGHSLKVIAGLQGVALETARTRLRRALERLRTELDARSGGDREVWLRGLLPWCQLPGSSSGWVSATTLGSTLALGAMKKTALVISFLSLAFLGLRFGLQPALSVGQPAPPQAGEAGPEFARISEVAPSDAERAEVVEPTDVLQRPTRGSLEVACLWEASQAAAGDVVLQLHPSRDTSGQVHATTDATGTVLFSDLEPGTWQLSSYLGGQTEVTIRAGETTTQQLRIPQGIDVHGRVVDEDGLPVPGAEVWLRRPGPAWTSSHAQRITDQEGCFVLKSVGRDRLLAARANGYGPSLELDLSQVQLRSGAFECTLVLPSGGARLEGCVLDPSGMAYEGALVCVGSPSSHGQRPDGTYARYCPPPRVRTDAEGRFSIGGLRPAATRVTVWTAEHPEEHLRVVLEPGVTGRCTIQLQFAAGVLCRVSDARGLPAAGVKVRLRPNPTSFPLPEGTTGLDGVVRLRPLRPGPIELLADLPATAPRMGLASWGRVRGNLVAGADTVVELQLVDTGEIAGRVIDEQGLPREDWEVRARDEEGHETGPLARTEADGSFRLVVAGSGPFRVECARRWTPFQEAIASRGDVRRGDRDVNLMIPDAQIGGRIVATLEDPFGRIQGDKVSEVWLERALQVVSRETLATERLEIGPVEAGSYHLSVVREGIKLYSTPRFEVHSGEVFDLGALRLEEAASLDVVLAPEAGLEVDPFSLRVLLFDEERALYHGLVPLGGTDWVAEDLAPGRYQLVVLHPELFLEAPAFLVEPGARPTVQGKLRGAVYQAIRCVSEASAGSWEELRVEVFDPEGRLVQQFSSVRLAGSSGQDVGLSLPPGSWRAHFSTETGLKGECLLEVGAHGEGTRTVPLR